MKDNSISLAIIVKNESERIVGFLAHHKPLVSEVVVVDTGSSDNTMAIAESAGANVYSFEWCDDFSAARNHALHYASCRYALCIDADERISATDFVRLGDAAKHHRRCYVMPQRNYYNNPQHAQWLPVNGEYPLEERDQHGYFEAQNTKFFDLHCGLQFEQRIHESVFGSARRNQIDVISLNVPIHHYGYVISEQHNQNRNQRYIALLEMKYRDQPNDVQTIEEYATSLIQMGKGMQAVPLLETLDGLPDANSSITRARILLGNLKKAMGALSDADAVFRRAVQYDPDALFAHVQFLRHLAEEKQFNEMGEALNNALKRFGNHPHLLKAQSQYLIETRQIHEAAIVTRKVAKLFPRQPEYARLASRCEALSKKVHEMERKL